MIKESIVIGVLGGSVALAMSLWLWGELPATVPVHWGADGQPDSFAPKSWGLMITPILALIMPVVIGISARIDPRRSNIDKSWPLLRWISMCTVAFMLAVHAFSLNAMLKAGQSLNSGLVMALVGVLYIAIGNVLPKFKSNFMGGVRTPWALSSETNWYKTQRVSGWSMMVAGILVIPLALLVPTGQAVWVAMPLLVLAPLVGVVYSFVLYQQEQAQAR